MSIILQNTTAHKQGKISEAFATLGLPGTQPVIDTSTRANIAHRSLVVNEDGLFLGLPKNPHAHKLLHPDWDWSKKPGYEDFSLVGNVILIKSR